MTSKEKTNKTIDSGDIVWAFKQMCLGNKVYRRYSDGHKVYIEIKKGEFQFDYGSSYTFNVSDFKETWYLYKEETQLEKLKQRFNKIQNSVFSEDEYIDILKKVLKYSCELEEQLKTN